MYKKTVIDAIQNQEWLDITFEKEKDGNVVTRRVAPYDIFQQQTGKNFGEERILGYTPAHENYKAGPITLYLKDLIRVNKVGTSFNSQEIRRLISPKGFPVIHRNW